MHNVRKGVRKLTVDLADRVLEKFGITLLDLLEDGEVLESLDLRNPDWRDRELRKPPKQMDNRRAAWNTKAG